MALFEFRDQSIDEVAMTTFESEGIRERYDIQRLLRDRLEIIAPECMVIAEEFSDWDESRRSIDLLALDANANLVVIELKRTEDGGHMELQALRYAAMVSAMTFENVVIAHERYRERRGHEGDARSQILDFLGWDEPNEDAFAQDVKIVLVSADFSKELTTAVMWLNDRGIEIECTRLRPYKLDGRLLVDVQQIIPLPEAVEYQVRVREKGQQQRIARKVNPESQLLHRFWESLLERAADRDHPHLDKTPPWSYWLTTNAGAKGVSLYYVLRKHDVRVELYIDTGNATENERIFDALTKHQVAIEQKFGGSLSWERGKGKRVCKLTYTIDAGGHANETAWPTIQDQSVDAMTRLRDAVEPFLEPGA